MSDNTTARGMERRVFKRAADSFSLTYGVKDPFAARFQFKQGELDGVVQDIGEGGVGMLTGYEIPVGAVLNLKFKIINMAVSSGAFRSRWAAFSRLDLA